MSTATTNSCPNCGAVGLESGKQCKRCVWIPLQSSEILFIDDEGVACPNCSTRRPVGIEECPQCGKTELLDASQHADNFHLSTIFILTTLVAICVGLVRVEPALGVIVSLVLGLSTIRTVVLLRERKRHRYPIVVRDMWRIFGKSIVGVVLFCAVWCFVCFFGGVILMGIANEMYVVHIPALIILLAAIHIPAGMIMMRFVRHRKLFFTGIVVGSVASGAVVLIWPHLNWGEVGVLFVIPL